MTLVDALSAITLPPATQDDEHDRFVRVVVRLARSRRTWFITRAELTPGGMRAHGFESGCTHSSARWFTVPSDFFEVAARANAEDLVVDVLGEPTPLAALEDSSI